ncbi:unnamed protein product [Prunus armeniaca]|uniref:Uncharacterized protein n=1 Tax=Prunus armeniaca TaxID=36596 RepID=A0A6J5VN77_PRUAR|nr:unnamed protein product [Prunus armeniaca]
MAALVAMPRMRMKITVFPDAFPPFCADHTDRRKSQSSIEEGLFQSLRLQQRRPKTKYAFVLLLLPLEISMLVELELRYSIISLPGTSNGGKFVLRIEDTDLERSTKESEEAVLNDLSWLGLDWDEGPGVDGDYGPYRQSERNSLYKQYAEKLLESGYVYRCFCSSEELEKMKEIAKLKQLPPVYTGKWANATDKKYKKSFKEELLTHIGFVCQRKEAFTLYSVMKVSWNLDTLGDFVIMRSNGQPVYNFCVTVDDATMAISHVIRAEEHLPNTLRQALIYKVDEWSTLESTSIRGVDKAIGERWKSTGILTESEGSFVEDAVQLLKDGIDLTPDSDKALSNLLSYPLHETLSSLEARPVLEDKLSEFAASFIAAYDSGELLSALEEGHAGWQKWVKSFGKSLKRKGKSLFMPLRVLLTGKLHGPDIGASVLLLHNGGKSGIIAPQAEFVTLDERFRVLRKVDWEALTKNQSQLETAATVST